MVVTRDQLRPSGDRQRDQVVVSGVDRASGRFIAGVGHHCRVPPQPLDGGVRVVGRDALAELGIRERSLELRKQEGRDDELEAAGPPSLKQARGGADRRDERGDDDVRVEDRAQRSASRPGRVLRLHRQGDRVRFRQGRSAPQALEEVESQVAAEGFLDDLAIALARPRGADLDPPKDVLVDRQRRSYLCHTGIIAS